jgi:hypothetical protein
MATRRALKWFALLLLTAGIAASGAVWFHLHEIARERENEVRVMRWINEAGGDYETEFSLKSWPKRFAGTQPEPPGSRWIRSLSGDPLIFDRVKVVSLKAVKLNGEVAQLAKLRSLEELHLESSTISDDAADALAQIKHLKSLQLHGATISHQGIQRLFEQLPDCDIGYVPNE